jgi:hypothetical protein
MKLDGLILSAILWPRTSAPTYVSKAITAIEEVMGDGS